MEAKMLLAFQNGRIHLRHGRLDARRRQIEVARHLVAQQRGNLPQEAAEAGRGGFLLSHQRQLVLDERMVDYGDACHETSRGWFGLS